MSMMIIHRKSHSALSIKGTVSMSANNAFQSCCCLLKPTWLMYPWVFRDTVLHIHTHGRGIPFGGIQSWELCFSQNLPREWPSCQLSLPCWGPSRRPQLSLPPAGHVGPTYCSGGPAGRSPAEGKERHRGKFLRQQELKNIIKAQIWCHWWKYWRDLTTLFLRDMADVLLSLPKSLESVGIRCTLWTSGKCLVQLFPPSDVCSVSVSINKILSLWASELIDCFCFPRYFVMILYQDSLCWLL